LKKFALYLVQWLAEGGAISTEMCSRIYKNDVIVFAECVCVGLNYNKGIG